jgi:membrane associated rhomboid family serine protease
MPDAVQPTPEELFRLCAAAAPKPWYPKVYARSSNVPRDNLDVPLTELRIAGLVKLTDWEPDVGQGYVLTAFGEEALQNPTLLSQLCRGAAIAPSAKPNEAQLADLRPAGPTTLERGDAVRAALHSPGKPVVTPVLILLNVLAFAASLVVALRAGVPLGDVLLTGDPTALHSMGALKAVDLVHNEWWRLLTCCFLHFGLIHIGVNMYALYILGKSLEALWGPGRFLILYLLSGLGGSATAMLYDPGPAVLAGASGAIWGLMTSIAVWIGLNRQFLPAPLVREWLKRWGLVVLLNVAISFAPNISASAHFGGGAVGVLVASLLHLHRYGEGPQRSMATAMLALTPVFLVAALNTAKEDDPRWQRLVRAEEAHKRTVALTSFREGPALAVAEVEARMRQVEKEVDPLIYQPQAKRDAEAVASARRELASVNEKCSAALEQLGDKPSAVPAVEKLRQAGREYVAALRKLVEWLDLALDPARPAPEGAEAELRQRRKEVQQAWLKWTGLMASVAAG